MVADVLNCIPKPCPFFPDLVVTRITPLAPLEPYNAAALGPLRTLIDSMSSGFKSAAPFPLFTLSLSVPPKLLLLIGTPSTTNKGWLFPNELAPLITIREDAPTAPDELVMF